nr:metallopeptidase, catalytic domain-containing protein [Tanacetum cinerariifolium]
MASRVTSFVYDLFFLVLSRPAIGKHLKAVSHYSYFPGNPPPRWPEGQTDLTYAFDLNFPDSFVPLVVSAFDEWASGSGYFTFSKVADIMTSNLKISFQILYHGDKVPNVIDFKRVALHEIGHLHKLGRSQYQEAIMWESFPPGMVKDKLTLDDIQRIKVLYGLN